MKTYNFDNINSEAMYSSLSGDYEKRARNVDRDASCGTAMKQISEITILGNKNGIKLIAIVTKTVSERYELYMDGELLNIFYNKRTAVSMFKDFSA